ncbi:MAG: sulfurtransferase TusA family protein [Mycobacteriales bacterium]
MTEQGPAALVLDCRGRPCPVPVIELARALPTVAVDEVVAVLSDDPAARLDIPAWCRMRGQDYLGEAPSGTFSVRRAG